MLLGVFIRQLVLLNAVHLPRKRLYGEAFMYRARRSSTGKGLLLGDPAVADVGGQGRVEHLNGFEIEGCNPVEDPLT